MPPRESSTRARGTTGTWSLGSPRRLSCQRGACSRSPDLTLPPRLHLHPIRDIRARMDDHLLPLPQSREHRGRPVALRTDLHPPAHRLAVLQDEGGPALLVAEERARGHLDGIRAVPDHHPHLDPEAVAETAALLGRAGEVDDYVDPLLLHSQGGDL